MGDTSKTPKLSRHWRFLGKHGLMVGISLASASLFMPTAKSTSVWELQLWLGLVFYIGLLFILDFIILRGRGRILTLLFILTGVAVVIEFPFSGIRRARFRARHYNHEWAKSLHIHELAKNRASQTRLTQPVLGWLTLPDGTSVPSILQWRVPEIGRNMIEKLSCPLDSFASLPEWYVRETVYLELFLDPNDTAPKNVPLLPRKHRAVPRSIRIRNETDQPFWKNLMSMRSNVNADWITNLVDLSQCERLDISFVNFSTDIWKEVLSSKSLGYLSINKSNIEDSELRSVNSMLERIDLIGNENLSPVAISDLVARNDRLLWAFFGDNSLTAELGMAISKSPRPTIDLAIVPDDKNITIDDTINFNNLCRLHIAGYDSLDTWIANEHKLIDTTLGSNVSACRLSCNDLVALSEISTTTGIVLNYCTIAKTELLAFGEHLVNAKLLTQNPFGSGDASTELNSYFLTIKTSAITFTNIQVE